MLSQQFLRIVFVAELVRETVNADLDDGIHAVRWLDRADLEHRRRFLRKPAVLRCITDYEKGVLQSAAILAGATPVQQRVADVLANAALV